MIPELPSIQKVTDNLRLLYHRNKNQHRRGKWWKWLAMLRRCLIKLLGEMIRDETASVAARTRYLEENLLPSCYVCVDVNFSQGYKTANRLHSSFTQLVHDNPFSTLGLVLLAQLSEIRNIILPVETGTMIPRLVHSAAYATPKIDPLASKEDFGEAVERSLSTDIPAMVNSAALKLGRGTTTKSCAGATNSSRSATVVQIHRTTEHSLHDKFVDAGSPQESRIILPQKKRKSRAKRPTTAVIDDLFKDLS